MKKPVPSPAPPSESEEQANQTQPRRRTNGGPSMSFSGIQLSSSISTQGLGNSGGSSSGSSGGGGGGGGGSSTTGGGGGTASGSNPSLPPSASSSLGSLRSLLAGSFVEDFICVSEFAEQHGPVPLLVVPKDGECGFNLNTYVVRIMAANYQKQACDVGEFAEDAQVALSEPTEDAQCYVHHLTLLDISARGYVRPICISYITRDQTKVMTNFERLLEEFSKISCLLKKGNQMIFLRDLEERLQLLIKERTALRKVQDEALQRDQDTPSSTDDGTATPPAARTESTANAPITISTTTTTTPSTTTTDEDTTTATQPTQTTTTTTDTADTTAAATTTTDAASDAQSTPPVVSFEPGSATPSERLSSPSLEASSTPSSSSYPSSQPKRTPPQRADPQETIAKIMKAMEAAKLVLARNFTGINPAISQLVQLLSGAELGYSDADANDVQAGEYSIGFVLHKNRSFEKALRPLDQLCGSYYYKATDRLQLVHQFFSRPAAVLTLEREDSLCIEPPSSLLAIGLSPVLNFNWETPHPVHPAIRIPHSSSPTSSESSSSPRSIDMFSMSEPSACGSPQMYEPEDYQYDPLAVPAEPLAAERARLLARYEQQLKAITQPLPETSSVVDEDTFFPLRKASRRPNEHYSPRLELESFAASLWGVANNDYGRKLMNVRKYPFYPQLIYSLLRGRLVVVLGLPRNEDFVKQIVSALTIFVAGYWRTPLICPWRTAPLRMADLGNLKLLGLAKHGTTHPIPKSVERYVTILDLEQEVLRAPQFRGGNFVLSIVAPRAQWPDEDTYLAYVHYKLFEIGMKACLYYHMCCVSVMEMVYDTDGAALKMTSNEELLRFHTMQPIGSKSASSLSSAGASSSSSSSSSTPSVSTRQGGAAGAAATSTAPTQRPRRHSDPNRGVLKLRDSSRDLFLQQTHIQDSDLEIVQYLADVVKEQQEAEENGGHAAPPVIRLDYAPCHVFTMNPQQKR